MTPQHLRNVIRGCIVMTYGPRQQCPKGRAPQSSSRPATRIRSTPRRRRVFGAGLFDLSAAGVSLPPTSGAAQTAPSGQRAQTGIYGQAATRLNPTRAVVRICQEPSHQRSGQPCFGGVAAAGARSWLNRGRFGNVLCIWNIVLIGCCQTSWRRPIRCWCPTSAGRSRPNGGKQR